MTLVFIVILLVGILLIIFGPGKADPLCPFCNHRFSNHHHYNSTIGSYYFDLKHGCDVKYQEQYQDPRYNGQWSYIERSCNCNMSPDEIKLNVNKLREARKDD